MAEPTDIIVPLLREMRSEMKSGLSRIEGRLDALEKAQNSFRQAPIESRVSELEASK